MQFGPAAAAFVTFQLADHWGNRTTPRPRPRADVVAAALLLAGSGKEGAQSPIPALAGRIAASGPASEGDLEAAWRAVVAEAACRGRYVEHLVSQLVSDIAASRDGASHDMFLAEQQDHRRLIATSLRLDARYRDVLDGRADATNRAILSVCSSVAAHLLAGIGRETSIDGLPQSSGLASLRIRAVGDHICRLQPWPFAGRRLRVHAEGLSLPDASTADEEGLQRIGESSGKPCHVAWMLLAPGVSAD